MGDADQTPIFGVPLAVAVERSRAHDGIQLPLIFRECVDYIEEFGLYWLYIMYKGVHMGL